MTLLKYVLLIGGLGLGLSLHADSPAGAGKNRLVVIAPERFHAALAEFARFKGEQFPTDLVALEKVLSGNPGVDDPERVKRFLYNEWRERGAKFALLVGDADVFPVRYMVLDRITPEAFDYAFYPSDLYYGDLAKSDGSFEDWNGRKDGFHAGYYGEVRGEKNKSDGLNYDGIDYKPELAVGRWPVSTEAEARLVAGKSMRYEQGLRAAGNANQWRAAFLAVSGWVDSRGLLDKLALKMPAGWSVEKRYYPSPGREPTNSPPTEAAIETLLNEGVGLMCHTGHGNDDCWEQCFFLKHLNRLTNATRLPVLVSIGCSTARFATLPPYEPYVDVEGKEHAGTYNNKEVFTAPPPPPACYQKGRYNPIGLGEQVVRGGPNGAAAYIGCNTGSQPCALTLLEGFIQALHEARQPRLGECWAQAVAYYFDHQHLATLQPNADWYPASIFFQAMKFMVYGDPTLPLPEPERGTGTELRSGG